MKKIILLAAAMMMAMSAQVMAADKYCLWEETFDDMSNWKITTTNKTATVEDGWLKINAFDRNDKFKDKENLDQEKIDKLWSENNDAVTLERTIGNLDITPFGEIEAEIKVVFPDIAIPEGYKNAGSNAYKFPVVSGKSAKNEDRTWWWAGFYWGRFLGYDVGPGKTSQDNKAFYPTSYWSMPRNTELYFRANINSETGKTIMGVYDSEGANLAQYTFTNWGKDVATLTNIAITIPEDWKANIDYIRFSAVGVNVLKATTDKDVVLDKAIRTDAAIKVEFTHEMDKETLSNITLTKEDGEIVEFEITQDDVNKKLYNIFVPAGLKYDAEYTLMISDTVTSENGDAVNAFEKVFTTEASPFRFSQIVHRNQSNGNISDISDLSGVTATKTILQSRNATGFTRAIEVIRVIYNTKGEVVKVVTDSFGSIGSNVKNSTTSTIDLTGLDAASMEVYIWDAFTGMHKIVE